MAKYGWWRWLCRFWIQTTIDILTVEQEWTETRWNSICTFCVIQIVFSCWGNKQTQPRLLVLEVFISCLPPEKLRDIAFVPSISTGVQKLWVSWIRSIHMKYVVFFMCRTIKILNSNWPRKPKLSQFFRFHCTAPLNLIWISTKSKTYFR